MFIRNAALIVLAATSLAWASSSDVEPGEEAIAQALALGVERPPVAPPRGDESEGPSARLTIREAIVIDGAGAPPRGPVTIEIGGDRITGVHGAGTGGFHADAAAEDARTRVIDAAGKYVVPGFIDAHVHLGSTNHAYSGRLTAPEYVLKLWLAHGITTVRDVGAVMGLKWTLEHKALSERNEIAAPRMMVHAVFPEQIESPEAARDWVQSVRRTGADGVKFLGAAPELIEAAIDEAKSLGMKTAYHHAQLSVARTNVLDSARMGLDSMEHWYGLPEAMFDDRRVQHYPEDYNYYDEQHRFGEAGRLWLQAAEPGSETWEATIAELVGLDFTINPTFTIYEANRDLMRARLAEWHDEYTLPHIMAIFDPNPLVHGSYFFDWTTGDEIAWKRNFRRWMQFINDYKNAGGRVTVGSDAGFIYKLYGFGYIRELELLQEAGFHPLEVLQSATIKGAELLGIDGETGSIQLGKKADLVIVDDNPLANFKVLYGTGHQRLNRETGQMERAGGIRYTIKDGVVYDAKRLLADVRDMVTAAKAETD
ncbi:MAG: amidohydrolase family protein [Gammaproteobacteria bacterium]|nr:amidohydrolase family protein [Gammaproteobacteria bacterium]